MVNNVNYKFRIEETEKLDNGCNYKVSLEVPMKDGWFEDVYFCIQKARNLIPVKLKHRENKDGIVYFNNAPVENLDFDVDKYKYSKNK